jgi:hypothetical protein
VANLPKIGWIGWTLLAAELAVLLKHHWDRLEASERQRMIEIVGKSRGRPSNLSDREKRELRELVDKIGPRELAGNVVRTANPLGRKRSR